MSWWTRQRAREQVEGLAGEGLDLPAFWRQSSDVLMRVVPHYLGACWYTLDPTSLLITSHFQEGLPEFPAEWLAHEYYADDVNKLADVARSARGLATLHEATDGEPSRSPRWHANMAYGGDQELIAALRTTTGANWGALGLYREPGEPLFDADEIAFVQAVTPALAEGARRALLVGEATDPEGPDAPGLLVLSERWEVESVTPGVERWFAEFPDGDWEAGRLPASVLAVAGQALRTAARPGAAGESAVARVRTRAGRWVVLHGSTLRTGGSRRIAVIVEPGHADRIAPLLMSAYGLSEREQEITRLVLRGNSTAEIAARLIISPQTVQQHLKGVFEKTGVRSRRDLAGKVFFAHFEPRLRDNERRAAVGKPLRGGPLERRASA